MTARLDLSGSNYDSQWGQFIDYCRDYLITNGNQYDLFEKINFVLETEFDGKIVWVASYVRALEFVSDHDITFWILKFS
jgi:hypothetical protein